MTVVQLRPRQALKEGRKEGSVGQHLTRVEEGNGTAVGFRAVFSNSTALLQLEDAVVGIKNPILCLEAAIAYSQGSRSDCEI